MTPPNAMAEATELSHAMTRYANGDDRGFALVYRTMAPRLFGFLLKETRNRALAEDLVQQTFLQVHSARSRYMPGTDVVPWFFAIARHLMIDARRRNRPSTSLPFADETRALPDELVNSRGADEELYSKQLGSLLESRLRRVPEKLRVAFQLVKLGGMSHSEVADTLGTTSTAVKVRIHRVGRMLLEASRERRAISADRSASSASVAC